LTKPPGALGRLEELAVWYAGWRDTDRPSIDAPQVIVFAGNHGVCAQGVSAFPPEVTVQMVANFEHGGAAINQLAKTFGAKLDVHALDLDLPTQDFTTAPAMSEAEVVLALATGWNAVDPDADLLVTGEMGIGNTTSAAAVAAGRELAAMAGAIAAARHHRIPVILDGFICCAAAATLEKAVEGALDHTVAGHLSAEGAHGRLLSALGKEPLVSLGLRLGEGSGGTLAIGILKGAIACHSGMATFAEAGVAAG